MPFNKVLVIGSNGYIGSRLMEDLPSPTRIVCGVSRSSGVDYGELEADFIQGFHSVILLAGLSGKQQRPVSPHEVYEHNVSRFVGLLGKMRDGQRLIYASSAGVYGMGTGGGRAKETDSLPLPVHVYDASKVMVEIAAGSSGIECYGFRLGTCAGYSRNMRWTVPNQMVRTAFKDKRVHAIAPDSGRAVAALSDVSRACAAVLDGPPQPGIYNVASYNTNIGGMAKNVVEYFANGGGEIEVNYLPGEIKYDCGMETTKFQRAYSFSFTATPFSVISELMENKHALV